MGSYPTRVLLDIFVESGELPYVTKELASFPEVLDLYELTGGADLRALIRTESLSAFRDLLVSKILKIRGIRSTTSAIILFACKERSQNDQMN
jgi:DNA-binding Lrp family transcriptional regulator